MDKPRLSPKARALGDRIDTLFDGMLLPASERKPFTAKLEGLLEEGDNDGYASSGRLELPLEYQSRVYGLIARPDADPDVRADRLEQFGLILACYLEVPARERTLVWTDIVRSYPAPAVPGAGVPSQVRPSGRASALPL